VPRELLDVVLEIGIEKLRASLACIDAEGRSEAIRKLLNGPLSPRCVLRELRSSHEVSNRCIREVTKHVIRCSATFQSEEDWFVQKKRVLRLARNPSIVFVLDG
jgi:hypothetical protein